MRKSPVHNIAILSGLVWALLVFFPQNSGAKGLGEFEATELWFNSLDFEQRTEVQDWLIWTGDYNHLVDGTFGSSTNKAIRSFERRNGARHDGTLDVGELTSLRRLAEEEQLRTGFQQVYDNEWRFSLGLPTKKIAKKETNNDGTLWESKDQRLIVTVTTPPLQSGTGFFVTWSGNLLTNAHVVEGCTEAVLRFVDGREVKAEIADRDPLMDLAVLRSAIRPPSVATFRSNPPLRLGTDIIIFGYPLIDRLTSTGNLVSGLVSGLAGPKNDASLIQISAPVQSGNSGGAVLDKSGHVVGVVVAKTNIAGEGDQMEIIQQANFAINGDVARAHLLRKAITPIEAPSNTDRPTADIADDAREFTAIVLCQPGSSVVAE